MKNISLHFLQVLKLSNGSRKGFSQGEIVNFMSIDSGRFLNMVKYLISLICSPLEICISLYGLWNLLGDVFALSSWKLEHHRTRGIEFCLDCRRSVCPSCGNRIDHSNAHECSAAL